MHEYTEGYINGIADMLDNISLNWTCNKANSNDCDKQCDKCSDCFIDIDTVTFVSNYLINKIKGKNKK